MWKYVPDSIGLVDRSGARPGLVYARVASLRAQPPGHSVPAIRKDFWALEVKTDRGTRYFGYETAPSITPSLRMAVRINPRDEVQRAWEDVDAVDAKFLKG